MKKFRLWLASLIYPEFLDELSRLKTANTKLVLKSANEEKYIHGN